MNNKFENSIKISEQKARPLVHPCSRRKEEEMINNFEETMQIEQQGNGLIKNEDLDNLIKFKLGKSEYTKQDLFNIKEIRIDGKTIADRCNFVYWEDLKMFPNLKEIEINNVRITNENLKQLINIEKIKFREDEIEDISILANVRELSLTNVQIDNNNIEVLAKLDKINKLELINMNIQNFEFLKDMKYLKELKLKNIRNFSTEKINFYMPIEYLALEEIDKLNLEVIKKFSNLKKMSIGLEQEEQYADELKKLQEKGVEIYLSEIYNY